MKPTQRQSLTLLLLALVVGCKPSTPPRAPQRREPPAPASTRDIFTDVTQVAGIRFRHVNGGFGKKYMLETMGSGCAFWDFDSDGWLDILLLNGKRLQVGTLEGANVATSRPANGPTFPPITLALYRNNRDGTFTDVTRGSGLEVEMYAMGCAVGDYDNDGRDDVYITCVLGPSRLFRNEGNGKFREVTQQAGVDNKGRWGSSCAWVDYDRDGWLDLFIGNYVRYRSFADDKYCSLLPGRKSYCTPQAFEGEPCTLYRNNRDGTFTDVSRSSGIADAIGKALGVALLDYDGDGWMDIAVANDEMPNFLFHNLRNGQFEEVGFEMGVAVGEAGNLKAGMGIDATDVTGDGTPSILISNFSHEGLSFFRLEDGMFLEVASAVGFREPSLLLLGFGLFFFDFDNDGWKDAFVANGHVNDDIHLLYSNVTYGQRNLLFRNRGQGRFEDFSAQAGAPFREQRVSRGAAGGDYDNDGDVDILITNNNDEAQLWRNDAPRRNWLQVELRGGKGSNRNGIGAKVRIGVGGMVQTDWVRSGSSYCSQSMLRLHFGLGDAPRVDWIEVTWTNGRKQRLTNVRVNQRLTIEEAAAPSTP
ncbi:MAG: CRTAC1 family protein [Abditibacteriales bacterium]|nr:CRTAC1 family protein [Abditibacteriales bacterium]MDW8366003.1 CRTAC1 family protein [Abditibacteriales bacterium]